jgi:hypothetical protein
MSSQDASREFTPILTGPVAIWDQDNVGAGKKACKLRRQPAGVHATGWQSQALQSRGVFDSFDEMPDLTGLWQTGLAVDVGKE